MQRSGDDAQTLKAALWLLVLVYEPLTSLYPYLPAFLAFGAWRATFGGHWLERIIWPLYFYLFEADHSLPPLSLILTLLLYGALMRRLDGFVACRVCLYLAGVPLFYGLLVGVTLFYAHILGLEQSRLALEPLLVYFVWDLVLVYAL